MKKLIVASSLLLLIGCDDKQYRPPESPLLEVAAARALLQDWRAGKVVVLIRHAERCDSSTNPCLDGERGITVVGRDMAQQLGKFFTEMPEVARQIYTSPVKRTVQTTSFMFGADHKKADWVGRRCTEEMYGQVTSTKQPGENLLLMTHSNGIVEFGEAENLDLVSVDIQAFESYGIVFFFSMEQDLLPRGHLLPSDWPVFLSVIRSQL